jgi:hypothetical protein
MAYTTIDNPELYFQTKLYTGNGSSRSITFDGSENMQPDWCWFKARSEAYNHALFDSVRGTTKLIRSNQTTAEETHSTTLTAFNSNGFSLGGGDAFTNANSVTYASWHWKAGTSFTNDASSTGIGTIDSSGSVSDTAGFSIVSYTGTGSAGTLKHGLSTPPAVVLVKSRGGVYGWGMYHHKNTSAPETDYLSINNTDATVDDAVFWNDTAPTSSVFSLGGTDAINKASTTHIAYCFAEKQGYSKFGSYTGNGNADGTFVYTGFKPAFLITKRTDSSSSGDWNITDSTRNPNNVIGQILYTNLSNAEGSGSVYDFYSNGFKIRESGAGTNASGSPYIYMCFAENPFVTSSGVPACAR